LVTFNATHFADTSTFAVSWANAANTTVTVCSGETNGKGNYSCTFQIPATHAGAHPFTGADGKGNTLGATFTVHPQLVLTPASGLVGTLVSIQGTGFGGRDNKGTITGYHYWLNWTVGTVCASTTSGSGGFNCSLTIPAVPAGAQTFKATDNASNTASSSFNVSSGLSVGPTYGPDGTNVTFGGTGFAASSKLNVTWAGGTACSTTTLGTGVFTCGYTIPAGTSGGQYTFTAKDSATPKPDTATVPYVVTFLDASPAYGPVGTPVTFTAGGFAPASHFNISWGGILVCTGTTSPIGAFSCGFNITSAAAGAHTFTGTDSALPRPNSANAEFTVEPALYPSPGYGPIGTNVTFNGTGFAGNSSVTVTWARGQACAATTSATGRFQCLPYTIPKGTAGNVYAFNATDAGLDVATATFVVTYLVANPSSGAVSGSSTVNGGGFPAATNVTVNWGATILCTKATNASGTFSCPLKVPPATAGPHNLSAVDGKYTAWTNFTVTPQLIATPHSGANGTPVKFTGTGYAAYSRVWVNWSRGTACSNTTGALGGFNCSFVIPLLPASSYTFVGTDNASNTANLVFAISAGLVITPSSGPVGKQVGFVATGFGAGASITISWTGGVACNGTTNATGTYSCTFKIPPTPASKYVFTASDRSSHTATAAFHVLTLLTDNPGSGPVTTVVTFSGTGYPAAATIDVNWTGPGVIACSALTSLTGGFTCSFSVPATHAGVYVFTGKAPGANGNTSSANFTVIPSLVVSPTRGPVGTNVTFYGTGYGSLRLANVSWSEGLACSAETGAAGSFACSFQIPAATVGVHSFTGYDPPGTYSAMTTFTVIPQLTISPPAGSVGTLLTFNGTGFNSSSAVTVSWAGGPVCPSTTSTLGSFVCYVTLPAATFGVHLFTATDNSTDSASANFTVIPQLTANPSSGLVGTPVTFIGTGYAGGVAVTVSWASGVACSNSTSATGGFVCRFTIPAGTPGNVYGFTGTDGANDTAEATFTVVTSLAVAPTHGPAGTSITFTGTGYNASSTVTVSWAGGTACIEPTSAGGTFSCTFKIPTGTAGGSYTFTGKDLADNVASTTFVVTFLDVAPLGGVVGTSVNFTAGGFAPSSPFQITWTDGTACSGSTTATGTFRCSYVIPAVAVGPYTFTATDGGSEKATTIFTVFGVPSATAPSPAPGHPAADAGQSVTFSTTASGGSGTYVTYTWTESSPSLGCALNNATSITCIPTAPGPYTVTVVVTDSNGVPSSPSTSGTFTVSTDPTVSAPTLNVSGADVGQGVTFSTTTSGGSGGLTFTWSGLPTGCSGTTMTFTCAPTAAVTNASVTVTVTDSNGYHVTSKALLVTIYSDPIVATPTASRVSADIGQTVTFTATASGGSGGLVYSWSDLPGCSGTGSVVTCLPTASGTFTVNVEVTDSNGFRVTSSSLSFTVFSDPTVTTPSPSRSSIDLGQSVNFTVVGANGSGALTYTWSLPTGCSGTTATITCTPSASGSFSVTATVTDSNGFPVTSKTLTFVVHNDPSAATPTATVSGADLGQNVTFSVVVSGGSGGFTFVWSGLPTGCAGTTATVLCSDLATTGNFTVSVTATDSNGHHSTSPVLAFRVDPDPTVTTPTASAPSADVNQSVTFSTTAGAGSGGFTFAWAGLPAGCTGTTAVVVCVPAAAVDGTNITVSVTDSNGYAVVSHGLVYTVYPDPDVTTPTATPANVDVGQSASFSSTVSGGAGGLTFTWSGLPAGCEGTTATVDCTGISGAGTYSIMVTVEDSNDFRASSGTLSFTVFTDPSVTTPVASRSSVDVGQTVTFTATGAGGNGTLTYVWTGLPSKCTGTATGTVSCTPTAALASTSIAVTVTDANGISATSASIPFAVDSSPAVTLTVSPSSILKGGSVTFDATASQGSGGFTYNWTGLPAGCSGTGSVITCSPTVSGTFTVNVKVTDSNLGVASANTTLTVNPTFLGLPAAEGIAILVIGILLAVVVAVILTVLLVRRRRRLSAPAPWAPTPPSPPATEEAVPPPMTWSPPPAAATPPEEPSPWEMPPPEPPPEESGSPPEGQ